MNEEPRASTGSGLTTGLIIGIIVLLLALVGTVAFFLGSGGFSRGGGSSDAPAVVIETQTSTRTGAPAAPAAPAPANPAPAQASNCNYGNYAAGTSKTSDSFAANVYSAFKSECERINSPAVTVVATSPVTGQAYTMNCSGVGVVYCRGGNNAVVRIW